MKLIHLDQVPITQVSHNAKIARKRYLGNDEIQNITNFSMAIFPPGEIANEHSHPDMVEVFYVLSGQATMTVDGVCHKLSKGSCIKIDCNEQHELKNVGDHDLEVLYFGTLVQ